MCFPKHILILTTLSTARFIVLCFPKHILAFFWQPSQLHASSLLCFPKHILILATLSAARFIVLCFPKHILLLTTLSCTLHSFVLPKAYPYFDNPQLHASLFCASQSISASSAARFILLCFPKHTLLLATLLAARFILLCFPKNILLLATLSAARFILLLPKAYPSFGNPLSCTLHPFVLPKAYPSFGNPLSCTLHLFFCASQSILCFKAYPYFDNPLLLPKAYQPSQLLPKAYSSLSAARFIVLCFPKHIHPSQSISFLTTLSCTLHSFVLPKAYPYFDNPSAARFILLCFPKHILLLTTLSCTLHSFVLPKAYPYFDNPQLHASLFCASQSISLFCQPSAARFILLCFPKHILLLATLSCTLHSFVPPKAYPYFDNPQLHASLVCASQSISLF